MLSERQFEYHHRGWTVMAQAAPQDAATRWAENALRIFDATREDARLDDDGTGEDKALDEGGAYRYRLLNGSTVRQRMPELWGFYIALPLAVTAVVSREVITSPYPLSAVNVKLYEAPGGTQGWHRDTNAVTALLYLTDDAHPTIVENLFGQIDDIEHMPGDLLLMQGRRCRHHVPPLSATSPTRITVPLNLYHPDDTWRPEGIDDIVYGISASG